MTKLNQIIAIEKGIKNQAHSQLTAAHHQLLKTQLLTGQSGVYQPLDEEQGERFPSEIQKVQLKADEVVNDVVTTLTRLFDVVATKDVANTEAKANVVVDGKVLLEQLPVTYLLFLEKQLEGLHTLIKKLPVLDPAQEWEFDSASDVYVTEPVQSIKTKKQPRTLPKAMPTKEFPNIVPQVDVWMEDALVGYWHRKKFSGAVPATRQKQLLDRVEVLQRAVVFAREEANTKQVVDQKVGKAVFDYLLAP